MAATDDGHRLTTRHRHAQLQIRAAALRELLTLWPLLDPRRLDATVPQWVRLAGRVIGQYRRQSAAVSADYLRAFKELESESSAPAVIRLATAVPPPAGPALIGAGPAVIKKHSKAMDPDTAARLALPRVAGAAGRHVLDGGRDTLQESLEADRDALGWMRVTDPDPCAFCAMLAARGPAYRSAESAGGRQTWHDNCACTVEPVFTRDTAWPEASRRFHALWNDATAGTSGKQARIAFRRALENR